MTSRQRRNSSPAKKRNVPTIQVKEPIAPPTMDPVANTIVDDADKSMTQFLRRKYYRQFPPSSTPPVGLRFHTTCFILFTFCLVHREKLAALYTTHVEPLIQVYITNPVVTWAVLGVWLLFVALYSWYQQWSIHST
jgi:hypothetical protein